MTTFFIIILFLFGAALGSFISVIIYRLHEGKHSVLRGRSMCPDCETSLTPLDLIPILSYLTLRGKCRYCSKAISYMYPVLELVTGGLLALLFIKFPFFDANLHFSVANFWFYLLHTFYIFVLIFTFFFDLRYLKIADEILLPAILIGLIATIGTPQTPHIFDALIGAAIALVFFGAQILLSKGTWLGLGDLRIGAFMGVILGWKHLIAALFLSYLIGSLISIIIAIRKKKLAGVKVPFAPFLVTGTLITLFFGKEIVQWYLRNLGF